MGLLSPARISQLDYCLRYFNMTWRQGEGESNSNNHMEGDLMMQRAVMFTAVLMAILGGTLCVVGLERLIRGRSTLFSMVRFLLRFTFVLFLPLLSYMASHAEGKEGQLQFVLLWLLLIELVRKKVEVMVRSADGSFSRAADRFRPMGHSDEVTRLVWIGYLIYSSIIGQGSTLVMTMFSILWLLALAKLGQRVLNEWRAQESLAAAGSAHLISGYMQHVLEEEESQSGGGGSGSGASTDPMANCKYLVMGEEKLVLKKTGQQPNSKVLTTPHCGYGVGRFPHDQDEQKHVHLLIDVNKVKSLVTVNQIWSELKQTPAPLCCFSNRWRNFIDHLRFLCLSFSFFKLLRRRFEHYPMVEVGSKMARRLMLEGLLNNHEKEPDRNAINAFRVLQLELDFLDNYYQAGVPVVISAPWLFFVNFLMSLLFVSIYVFAVLVIVTLGADENLGRYIIIAMLLVITLLSIEITELLTVYLFSNWFLVHLLCLYTAPGSCLWNCLAKPIICSFIAFRFLVFNSFKLMLRLTGRQIKTTKIKIKQVSILQDCEPIKKLFAWASHVTLATEAKVAIVESLKGIDLGTGNVSLPHISGFNSRGKTATEIILACHLATELLDMAHGKRKKKKKKQQRQPEDCDRTVATTLSRFCMYLVARAPELLPDNEPWVSDRYEEVKSCLKEASRRCYCGAWGRQSWKAVMETNKEHLKNPTAWAGVKLFQQVRTEDSAAAWKNLAEFWVKLLIYLAPSNDVEGHANALASSGGDLITCLWAFCTHAGIRRQHEDDGNQV
ncbi:uncharacterized protein LOC133891144 [Phragmites australis]|uniref:uncharacterized protein LOC133891144 n=1 Tax=Phragmites australis TaxID=29695 RepID=UPI002D777FB5|nr:uncharacterized protein LOC133891144 [Phragmites australis]